MHADEVTPKALFFSGAATADPETENAWEMEGIELFHEDGTLELANDDGFIVKSIMRTGTWNKTPGSRGVLRKPLKIVRDGVSSAKDRIVSLSEIADNFNKGAYQYVTIPLSDEQGKDHKNLTRLNTGFVKGVFLEDQDDGTTILKAKMHFTEPDVKAKVERGTIPDVSAGIYFNVENPDGEKYGCALNHVCLTKQPFIGGMEPFGVMASDDDDSEHPDGDHIEGLVLAGESDEEESKTPDWDDRLGLSWQQERLTDALRSQLNLSDQYTVIDIGPKRAVVENKLADASWVVGFELTGEDVRIDPINEWQTRSLASSDESEGSDKPDEPSAAPDVQLSDDNTGDSDASEPNVLEKAHAARKLRFSSDENTEGGATMSRRKSDTLEGLDFSDEDAVREHVKGLLEENQQLKSENSESEVDAEVDRVDALFGEVEVPGFLRVYRDILLSDDDEPAAVLLSHDDSGNETKRESVTVSEVAKRLVDSLPTKKVDDKLVIELSGQALSSGNDVKPPAEEEDEQEDVETRTRNAEKAVFGKVKSKPTQTEGE